LGQYHFICNVDKHEYLHPHRFGDGLKLLEFGSSGDGTMLGLAVLLAASNDRGGGDLHIPEGERAALLNEYIVGRWAGDRIVIVGDYHANDDLPGVTDKKIADTGGYRYDKERKMAVYDQPLYGDVPWNQRLTPDRDGDTVLPPIDLGWVEISDLVIEAMEMDDYVKSTRHEEHTYPSGAKFTRATVYGDKGPTSELGKDGTITRTKAAV
jgi:hypothetical protein